MKITLLALIFVPFLAFSQDYPSHWFEEIPRSEAESWEILPQDAAPGEVILSKRNELGIFSNFAATAFTLDERSYASIEGLWQSLKYPDPEISEDPRHKISDWPHTREEVQKMVGFEAKRAGNAANLIYRTHKIKEVSYGSYFFDYNDYATGSDFHYMIIKRAMRAKLDQNEGPWDLLMRTGCLILKPDHHVGDNDPPAYQYFKIFMELRSERQFVPCSYLPGKN